MTIPPLSAAIDAFRANDIATILRIAGVVDIPKSKEGKNALWAQMIGDGARIRQALNRLTPRCLQALQVLQSVGGEVRTGRYRALLERANLLEKQSRQAAGRLVAFIPGPRPDPVTFEEILATLLKCGLIWSHTLPGGLNTKIGFEGGQYVYIPEEVAVHLPPAPAQPRRKLQIVATLPSSARTCQRDLYLFWSAVREASLVLTASTNLLRVADLKRIAAVLLTGESISTGSKESDYRRLFFLRRLLTALSMLKSDGSSGYETVTATASPPLLSTEAAERVRTSFESWRDGAWWNELWAAYVPGQTRASGSLADLAPQAIRQARAKVLETLVRLAHREQEWIGLTDLLSDLQDHDYEYLIDRETAVSASRSTGYYRMAGYSPYQMNTLGWVWETHREDNDAAWNAVEGKFARAMVTEGLFWLGLVDLGYDRELTAPFVSGTAPAGATAFRLTEMGRWLLLDGPRPAIPSGTGRVVLQPNFHLFAFDPISDSVLARLDTFADRLRAERALEYEISRESIYRAQLAGASVAGIRSWLVELTGMPLPQNVDRSLDEWQVAFERITIRPQVALVQTALPELADAMEADPILRNAIAKRLTPTAVLVHRDQVDQVEKALLAAGELPARARGPEDARRGSIVVAADGEVKFSHAVPSLYVYGYLHPFADQVGTPTSPPAPLLQEERGDDLTPDPSALPHPTGRLRTGPTMGEGGQPHPLPAGGSERPFAPSSGWRITAESVRRASRAGMDASAILGELEQLALGGVPPELDARIKAWCKHYGDASLQTVTLIQFRDQEALDELTADPELAPYLKPFRPEAKLGLAAVRPEDVPQVQMLLDERGVELRQPRS